MGNYRPEDNNERDRERENIRGERVINNGVGKTHSTGITKLLL